MTKPDGSICVGCINKDRYTKSCKLGHTVSFIDGCRKCGKQIRFDTLHEPDHKNCEDYEKDPNYWQKDYYG